MKLDIKTAVDKNGKKSVVGWDIIPENNADEAKICIMRDSIFFGIGDTVVNYAGREGDENSDWPISKLKFRTDKYRDAPDSELDTYITKAELDNSMI